MKPQNVIDRTKSTASIAEQGLTYNQAGLTYNEGTVQYGGATFGQNWPAPQNSGVA